MVRFRQWLVGGVISGLALSSLVHGGVIGGLFYYWNAGKETEVVAELELSLVPSTLRPPNKGGGRGRPAEEWVLPLNKKIAPAPPAPAARKETEPIPPVDVEEPLPSEDSSPAGDGLGGGGTGEGHGRFVPASATYRKPQWVANFITTADYPVLARQNDKDGRVVLRVYIDEEGAVSEVLLLRGACNLLNEVALRKVKQAKFTPGYDRNGRPVPCQVVLPIQFELR